MSVRLVSIGDVVEKISTWNPISQGDGEFDYIDLSAIDQDTKRIVEPNRLSTSEAPSRARQLVAAGDVLVSTVRPNLNGVAKVGAEHEGMTASTGFCVLRPRKMLLSENYLFQWVKSPSFVKDMVQKATGASYPAVSDRIIKESLIPLPPLDEQKRIAAILDKADALRAKRRQAIALLDSLTQTIFLEMFGDPVSNSKGLPKKPLGELIKVSSGNGLTSSQMDTGGRYSVYGGNGINGNHSAYMFDDPQIAIGRVGVYCGAVHITKPKSWITDNALYVAKNLGGLGLRYLAEALRIANLNQYAGRAAQPLISGSRIYPVEILVPTNEAQLAFEKLLLSTEANQRNIYKSQKQIETVFSSLQHLAFTGQL